MSHYRRCLILLLCFCLCLSVLGFSVSAADGKGVIYGETTEVGAGVKGLDNPYELIGISLPDRYTLDGRSYDLPDISPLNSMLNGVCDEYNILTGEEIRRVGVKVLSNSGSWLGSSNGLYTNIDGMVSTPMQSNVLTYVSYDPVVKLLDLEFTSNRSSCYFSSNIRDHIATTEIYFLYQLSTPIVITHDVVSTDLGAPYYLGNLFGGLSGYWSITTVALIIGVVVGGCALLFLFWWGSRKVVRMIAKAFTKGRLNL